jgi:enolase 1/2/3
MKIKYLKAREILDSRGYPTVETEIELKNGVGAISSVPSGASTGTHEAVELRDGDKDRFLGKGVLKAVKNVNTIIANGLKNFDISDQEGLDKKMMDLDGSDNKKNLGANAILSVSEVVLKATAKANKKPLYKYVFEKYKLAKKYSLPQPTLNVINGGKHGNGKLEFQEFHILPRKNQSFAKMMEMGTEVYLHLQQILKKAKIFQGVGDEGGFTADFKNNLEALNYLKKAVLKAGFEFGKDVKVGLDTAASEFFAKDKYHISDMSYPLTANDLINYYLKLHKKFDFGYLEDGLFEDDWDNWAKMTAKFAKTKCPIIGDDFLTTNPERTKKAIKGKNCNAVLVKPNQIGTVTEVIEVVSAAKKAGWIIILSHRSGETVDDFVSDFAVGVGADIVKFGAPARGERINKYNRLMEIENELRK